ncbi:LysE family translocator [Dokdonia sp. LLG6352-1]|uniref:LysE family translocator n=1 Tax=Dokdonia sp. LLG6352-1 TaxID=3160831 RepID=UPI00386C0A34
MIILAFIIGFTATVMGALPPGASNLAVIKARVKGSYQDAVKLSYGAGLGESLLALTALSFGMVVQEFISMNYWVQYLVAFLLALVGVYFIVKKHSQKNPKPRKQSQYFVGFILSFINPPVLIYWVVVFSLLRKWMLNTGSNPYLWTILLLAGVFLGKIATLLMYSKFGSHIKQRSTSSPNSLNRYIGITLIVLSVIQLVKLVVS